MTTNEIREQRNGHQVRVGEARRPIGQTGLSIWGGIVREEYLPELTGLRREMQVYREMADDAIIRTLLEAIEEPLLAAEFDVVPGGDSQADADAATWLWDAINGMTGQSWRTHVQDALETVQFGFALSEIVLEKRDDGRLWLAGLEPRAQETVHRWIVTGPHQDRIIGVTQQPPRGTSETVDIPIEKLVHHTFGGRKGNPQGRSLLRAVYRSWRFLKNLENFEGIGIERDVGGMPVVELETELYRNLDQAALLEIFEDAMKNLRMDEEMYLVMPPGSTVKPYGSGSKSYNIREVIRDKQTEILTRFFAQFLKLGMEKVGTQALVKGSQDFFSLGLQGIQQGMLEAWNRQLVPFLFRFNAFPGITALPRITWDDPGAIDIQALLQAYRSGVVSRVLTPTREDEENLRGKLDLPDLPEGVGEEPRPQSLEQSQLQGEST